MQHFALSHTATSGGLSCFHRHRTFDVCAQVDRRAAAAAESVRTDCWQGARPFRQQQPLAAAATPSSISESTAGAQLSIAVFVRHTKLLRGGTSAMRRQLLVETSSIDPSCLTTRCTGSLRISAQRDEAALSMGRAASQLCRCTSDSMSPLYAVRSAVLAFS